MFGVSFIGGDPCASRLNDDAFEDQQDEKEHTWGEIKRLIDATKLELAARERCRALAEDLWVHMGARAGGGMPCVDPATQTQGE